LKGVAFSISASVFFGVLYGYVALLRPLDGEQVFVWRILTTVPGLVLIIGVYRAWARVGALWLRLRREPCLPWVMLVLATLLGVQLWLFLWAPLNGRALDVSLGYFLLPLTMVLVGRLVLHEQLSFWQRLAVLCALLGVGHELWRTLAFSWATAVVVLLYPPYFLLRRWFRIDALAGLFVETVLLVPVCAALLWAQGDAALLLHNARYWWQLPVLGLLSAAGLWCYLSASRLLSMGLFGLLSYVEPVLLFGVAVLLLGEAFAVHQWWTYGPVWLAVALLAVEGAVHLMRPAARKAGQG